MYVVDNMVSLPCVTFLLLLLNLLAQTFGQNNSENATSTSLVTNLLTPTATTALAPSSTRHPCVTSTVEPAVNVCSPSCSADVSLVGGVAVSSFVAGIIVGVLGVCVVLICVKRPCSLTKEESTQKTQRFTRSERSETVNKENAHRVRGEYEFLPTYHVKQNQDQLATTGDNEEEDGGGEEEKEEEDKMSIHKGPLPPPPVTPPPTAPPPPLPYLPPPPPPALSPPVHQKSCSKEYAIPHIPPSTTKRSDTLLEMYDIPDTSIPLGLTGNLSKSQILISDQSFTGKENKNKGQGKKALNVSLSMDDLPEMTSSTGTEHYYVMDPSPQPSSGAAGSKPR